MKKVKKGNIGFILGTILFATLLIADVLVFSQMFAILNESYSEADEFLAIFGLSICSVVFLGLLIWYVSFSTAWRQRRTIIELLEKNQKKEESMEVLDR